MPIDTALDKVLAYCPPYKLLDSYSLENGINIVGLAKEILSGLPPLLIWGILRESEVNLGGYTSLAVDIKSGDKLFFEFHPDMIYLYGLKDNPTITAKLQNYLEND